MVNDQLAWALPPSLGSACPPGAKSSMPKPGLRIARPILAQTPLAQPSPAGAGRAALPGRRGNDSARPRATADRPDGRRARSWAFTRLMSAEEFGRYMLALSAKAGRRLADHHATLIAIGTRAFDGG